MRRRLVLLAAALLAAFCLHGQEYPEDAREVAAAFMNAYETGDTSAVRYAWFDGKHVLAMGGTPEELRDELLPAELKRNRRNPADPEMLEVTFSEKDRDYKCDVWYAVYSARGKKHTLCLHFVEGRWKVDLSYLWMGDWYDWMPGY